MNHSVRPQKRFLEPFSRKVWVRENIFQKKKLIQLHKCNVSQFLCSCLLRSLWNHLHVQVQSLKSRKPDRSEDRSGLFQKGYIYLRRNELHFTSGSKSYSGGIQKGGKVSVKTTLVEATTSILNSKNASGIKLCKWGITLIMRKCKFVAVGGIIRKLAVAVWYLLKGFMPDVFDIEKDIAAKLRSIASDLTLPFILARGYKNNRSLFKNILLPFSQRTRMLCPHGTRVWFSYHT